MRASFVDLRTRSRELIEALRRNERITLLYRGKPAATVVPIGEDGGGDNGDGPPPVKAADHPAFGLWADRDDLSDPAAWVRRQRAERFDAD
jgi:antitoxin (DNA-binding transcriptional repressor) of toxin-antitoxin stability system